MINLYKALKIAKPLVITGFHSFGSVGTLAAQYLRDKLNAEEIGFLEVQDLPSTALLIKGEIVYPIRIFYAKEKNLIIFESELPLPQEVSKPIAEDIANFSQERRARAVVCLEGLAVKGEPTQSNVYMIFNERKFGSSFKGMKVLDTGLIFGLSADILLKCKARKIPGICIMAEAYSQFPDGKAAANVLGAFGRLFKIDIDVEPLIKESELFEKKMLEIVKKARELEEKPPKIYG